MDEKRLAAIEELFERTAVGDEWVFLFCDNMPLKPQDVRDLIAAVRERGEPVAWVQSDHLTNLKRNNVSMCRLSATQLQPDFIALHTAPPTVADALERAAKVCRDRADAVYDHAKGPYLECANAIRKLKEEYK